MNYGKAIVDYLQRHFRPQMQDEKLATVHQIDNFRFSLELADFDKFSFVLYSMTISQADDKKLDIPTLRKRAQLLREKITYLSEQLEIGEIDNKNCKLQLRSALPKEKAMPFKYFEITLTGTPSIAVDRFLYESKGTARMKTSYHLTEHILKKLINDFVAVLAKPRNGS